ncbi:MAG: DUF4145 domain-containing protein [Proteobacteria bacterium]|nr:DUF4145 domain-containing protein [Desulfobulbaceae bacterium]MBU4151868.1 DUF4145 domain-containing protein [Pseudomonadota bacterium]
MTHPVKTDDIKIIRAHCNRCGHKTKHDVVFERRQEDSEIVDPYNGYEISWFTTYTMLECRGCEDVCLKQISWNSEEEGNEEVYYPPRVARRHPTWFNELHPDYQALLAEIYAALYTDSKRLAMMGLRTVIDIFMARKLEDSLGFTEGIKELVEQNYLTSRSKEIIEAAVEAGNASAHRMHNPSSDQLNAVIDIVENLIQFDLLSASAETLRKTTPPRPSRKKKKKE